MAQANGELLVRLPDAFHYSEALGHVSKRQLRRLVDDGHVVAVSRGLYRKSGWLGDEDLVEVAARAPLATLCLRSSLARHSSISARSGSAARC